MHPCLLLAWLAPRRVIAPKSRDIRGAGENAPGAFDHYRHVHVPKTAGTVFRIDAARVLPRNATLGTRVLCALQPATRSALGATTAGRRLVATLDAGSLPRPKPGLLPRREDGVTGPACSFH